MTSRPAVTVVMPVRNPDPRHFPIAVESVLAQTLEDFELLIVEDVGERAAAEDLAKLADPRIRHLVHDGPGSMATARNRGLAAARSEFVAMFDADDICAEDRFERQLEYLQAEPNVTVLGSQLRILNDDDDDPVGARQYPTDHDAIMRVFPISNPIAHPSVMMRKSTIEDVGGYRDRTCEDYDLWSRLAHRGARFANHPEALLSYRVHDSATKRQKLRESLRDTIRIKKEHWKDTLGLRGRWRLLGERTLLLMPPSMVMGLFGHLYLRDVRELRNGVRA